MSRRFRLRKPPVFAQANGRCVTMHFYGNTRGAPMNEATFQVDEVLKSEFTTAAKSSDRNAAQVLRGFMRD